MQVRIFIFVLFSTSAHFWRLLPTPPHPSVWESILTNLNLMVIKKIKKRLLGAQLYVQLYAENRGFFKHLNLKEKHCGGKQFI